MSSDNTNDSKRNRDNGSQDNGGGEAKRQREEQESSQGGNETDEGFGHLSKEQLIQICKEQRQDIEQKDRVHKNRSFESLMEVKETDFDVSRVGSAFSHANGPHISANKKDVDFDLSDPNLETIKSMTRCSCLLYDFVDQDYVEGNDLKFKPKTYVSEADICSFVSFAVKDAISILEIEGTVENDELAPILERSLFGCRPDIMVVRNQGGVGYLAIEVKQPVAQGKPLIAHPKVVGHAYDHAAAMNAFGQGTAMVMITSFTESNLCSLIHSDFRTNMATTPKPTKSTGAAKTQSPPLCKTPVLQVPVISHQNPSDASSPANSHSSASAPSPPVQDTVSESVFSLESDSKRELFATKTHQSHQLVKLIYNAIRLAISNYKGSTKEIHKLEPEKAYQFHKALRVVAGEKENYGWGQLCATLGKPITSQKFKSPRARASKTNTIDRDDDNSYYIIGSLGHGLTSNVFQALDSNGAHVALKVYVKNEDGNGNLMNDEDFNTKAKEATEKEAGRLCEFYPFLTLDDNVKTTKVFGRSCVVMPFFEPLEKDNREDMLKDIRDVLENKFLAKRLCYSSDDLRWRHVGRFQDKKGNTHCVLYDLADLEVLDGSEADSFVDDQMKILKDQIEQEPKNRAAVYVNANDC